MMSAVVEQKQKTIQFWDKYHSRQDGNDNPVKEWILQPSVAILETLYNLLPTCGAASAAASAATIYVNSKDDNGMIRVLEIGCGTSTLARDFWLYCRNAKNRRDISVCATDVSHVCIQQNIQRDQALMEAGEANEGKLTYKVLNITSSPTEHSSQQSPVYSCSYDLILDKGCLDTFLFRSRKRGEQKDFLVVSVLRNIHALLREPCSSSQSTGGIYTIQTPRRKFRPVQDFPGFDRVERTMMDDANAGMLVPTSSPEIKQNGVLKREHLYLYCCYKGTVNIQFQRQQHTAVAPHPPLVDADACAKCGLLFRDLRKGEDVHGRGIKYWTRMFRGHARHCKGNAIGK